MLSPSVHVDTLHLAHGTSWRYLEAPGGRDERIDFLRGIAILGVIINHLAMRSLYHIFSAEALGVTRGAEICVLLSGLIIGLIYHGRLERDSWSWTARKLISRALQIYLVALVTNVVVYLLQWFPGIDVALLTTASDGVTGQAYDLYGNNPLPATLIVNMFLLSYGVGQINVLGLYITLTAVTPALLWLLRRRQWLLVIGLSWLLYIVNAAHPLQVVPFQSERGFSLLAWQLLFVHGLLAGYYRRQLQELLTGRAAPLALLIGGALFLAFWFFALNNIWSNLPGPTRLNLIPESTYRWIYLTFFQRRELGIGRFLNTILVVGALYALLTYCWVPCERLAGWLFIPLGQATLYIFVVHLGFVLIMGNVTLFQQGDVLINTLAHTAMIATTLVMVRRRVLFRFIPR